MAFTSYRTLYGSDRTLVKAVDLARNPLNSDCFCKHTLELQQNSTTSLTSLLDTSYNRHMVLAALSAHPVEDRRADIKATGSNAPSLRRSTVAQDSIWPVTIYTGWRQ